jgi:hypothetical protein
MKSSQMKARPANETRRTTGKSPGNNPTVNSCRLLWKYRISAAEATKPKVTDTTHTNVRRILNIFDVSFFGEKVPAF